MMLPKKHKKVQSFPENPAKVLNRNNIDHDAYEDYTSAVSAHDCTGLIPSGGMDSDERDNYESLYDMPLSQLPDSDKR